VTNTVVTVSSASAVGASRAQSALMRRARLPFKNRPRSLSTCSAYSAAECEENRTMA
jgi:hypothetical protein